MKRGYMLCDKNLILAIGVVIPGQLKGGIWLFVEIFPILGKRKKYLYRKIIITKGL